jgi:hypothetical protein
LIVATKSTPQLLGDRWLMCVLPGKWSRDVKRKARGIVRVGRDLKGRQPKQIRYRHGMGVTASGRDLN